MSVLALWPRPSPEERERSEGHLDFAHLHRLDLKLVYQYHERGMLLEVK